MVFFVLFYNHIMNINIYFHFYILNNHVIILLQNYQNFKKMVKMQKKVIALNNYLSKIELYEQNEKNTMSPRTKALLIKKLIEKGIIAKVENDKYKLVNKKKYHIYRDYDGTIEYINLLNNVKFDYIIYNITFLNEWLNQLIGKNTIFIEVDKKYMNSIYDILLDNDCKNILINPSLEEIDKYSSSDLIIIKPLFTRSPINRKEKSFEIEKVIVDLFTDNILRKFYSTSELPDIYREIFKTYAIDEFSLNAYLSRRNLKDRFYEFLKNNNLENKINDWWTRAAHSLIDLRVRLFFISFLRKINKKY